MELVISIEISGKKYRVGRITGTGAEDACFSYDRDYIGSDRGVPVSISLPFQENAFSQEKTRTFFEGLLPEGFTRKTVAEWIHADERDYLTILSALGKECLGALQVTDAECPEDVPASYEKLSLSQVQALAREGAAKSAELVTQAHLSLTGASGKVGLYYDRGHDEWYLPKGSAPSTHIVKQSHVRLNGIVTNEQLCLLTAEKLGIEVPETFIINTGEYRDSDVLFATSRYDRVFGEKSEIVSGINVPLRLHQEDFGQALGIPSSLKYERPGEHHFIDMLKLLRSHSSDPINDRMKLWDRVVFNFLVGNTDAHVKNFSLIREQDVSLIRLAPAYDIISTTVYPASTRRMAFSIAGVYEISEITRNTFSECAIASGIGERLAMSRFDELAGKFTKALMSSAEELADNGYKNAPEISREILRTGGINNISVGFIERKNTELY